MTCVAILHAVGDRLGDCELTFASRRALDVERARQQHAAYAAALRACGADVRVVDVSPRCPDAVFVEDAAVVLDEVAIATSMGVASRRSEVDNLLPVLASLRPVVRIGPAATLEGGDVLRVGRTLFVGASSRTNADGIGELRRIASDRGYRVVPVAVRGALHLKTAVTAVDDETLVANPDWVDLAPLAGFRVVPVAADEPFAANTLRVGATRILSAAHPRTAERVAALGHDVRTVDIGELEKAEAGVTCLSILVAAG